MASWNEFEVIDGTEPRKSLLWASEGEAGSGKSWFALTAPGPIWVAAFDPWGTNRVDPSIKVGKEIRISRYPFDASKFNTQAEVKAAATRIWNQYIDDYSIALDNARSIIIDREDGAYKIQRYSAFGGTNAAPKEYEDLYLEYTAMLQAASKRGVNLGLLRGLKDKWESEWDPQKQKKVGLNTGKRIPDGNDRVPDQVDIVLNHRWDDAQKAFVTTFGKFTNKDFRGMEALDLDFPTMAVSAYPESSIEDWA